MCKLHFLCVYLFIFFLRKVFIETRLKYPPRSLGVYSMLAESFRSTEGALSFFKIFGVYEKTVEDGVGDAVGGLT